MIRVYLITYKDHNTIEGFVKEKEDFDKWLDAHNKGRLMDGNIEEGKDEFEIKEIYNLWK